jgi:hypothetical protein
MIILRCRPNVSIAQPFAIGVGSVDGAASAVSIPSSFYSIVARNEQKLVPMRLKLAASILGFFLLAAAPVPTGKWAGVLPSSAGPVRTELALYPGLNESTGHFRWSEASPSTPNGYAPRVETGTWNRLRDSDIIQLIFSRPGPVRNFLLAADGSLRELDRQLEPRASLDTAAYALFPITTEPAHPIELRAH